MSAMKRSARKEPAEDQLGHDLINKLNYYCLHKVFSYLPLFERIAMKQVCKRWRDVCEKISWYDMKKYKCGMSMRRVYDNRLLEQSDVEEILSHCRASLRELSLSKICDSSIMPVISTHCTNITSLEFTYSSKNAAINADHFNEAFLKLDKLKSIKILETDEDCVLPFPSRTIDSLTEEIREIHLDKCYPTPCDAKPFLSTLVKFNLLSELTICGWYLGNAVEEILRKDTLVYLNLKDSSMEKGNLTFDQLVNLQHLNISSVHNVDNNTISSINRHCPNLEHLDILWCRQIQSDSLPQLTGLRNLQYLDVSIGPHIDDEFILNIINNCKNLKHLEISCNIIYVGSVSSLALSELTRLENLEYLSLGTSNNVDNDVFIEFINNFKKTIKHLNISYTIRISPFALNHLSKCENLEYLNLRAFVNVTDCLIIGLSENCKNLGYLNITFATGVSENALLKLTELKNLKTLIVSNVYSVTNCFISKLKKLERFECAGCTNINDSGIIQLIKNCPDLEYLDLSRINVTSNFFFVVDRETKHRLNDIVLNIVLYSEKYKEGKEALEKLSIKSYFLKLECAIKYYNI